MDKELIKRLKDDPHFKEFQEIIISKIDELNFIGGVADIKVIVIIGMMIAQLSTFFIFMITIMIFGIAYKIVWRYVLKKPEGSEVPFIISLWAVYCVLWITGGLI